MITSKVSDLIGIINKIAPFCLAEEWDNAGLQVGDPAATVTKIMVALDAGPAALKAAIAEQCQLLLTHHPLIFSSLKKVVQNDPVGSILSSAVKNNLAIVSLHTNYDISAGGVNDLLAARLGVVSCEPLKVTGTDEMVKLIVFVPQGHEERLLEAIFPFCSSIGNYRDCSFHAQGTGTFTPLAGSAPYLGEVGRREHVAESRIEVLLSKVKIRSALKALRAAHPYEEPAFDLYPLVNRGCPYGLGRIGVLEEAVSLADFALKVKVLLDAPGVRFVGNPAALIRRIALCGGSGASLLREALFKGAEVLLTGDIKYHDAREAEQAGIALIDAGHFATERVMVRGFADQLARELKTRSLSATVLAFDGERDPFRFI